MGENEVKMTLFLDVETHKRLTTVCKIEERISYQEYITYAVKYALSKGIVPPKKV